MDRNRRHEIEDHFEAAGWISAPCGLCSPVVPHPLCTVCGGVGRVVKRSGVIGTITYARYVLAYMGPEGQHAPNPSVDGAVS